jgi:hypothetical protein
MLDDSTIVISASFADQSYSDFHCNNGKKHERREEPQVQFRPKQDHGETDQNEYSGHQIAKPCMLLFYPEKNGHRGNKNRPYVNEIDGRDSDLGKEAVHL